MVLRSMISRDAMCCDAGTTFTIRACTCTNRVCLELCARSDPLSLPARSMKLSLPIV